MRCLITGAAGFVGHHVTAYLLRNTAWQIVALDKLNYASYGWARLRQAGCMRNRRFQTFETNLSAPMTTGIERELGGFDLIIHMAAASHVDRSIAQPQPFVSDNIMATTNILDFARNNCTELQQFIYFSTDEVYGSAPENTIYKEGDRYYPGNPYAATKAGAEAMCYAYANTYGMPITITNTMNVFGNRQHPEKFIPKVIRALMDNDVVQIHADPTGTIPGSRFWIHADQVAEALLHIWECENETLYGADADCADASYGKYHIVGMEEIDNLELAKMIANAANRKLRFKLVDFHTSRPGHDLRYAMSGQKLSSAGWKPREPVDEKMAECVRWYLENPGWLRSVDV